MLLQELTKKQKREIKKKHKEKTGFYDEKYKDYIGRKLGKKLGKQLGEGHEGIVFALDSHRAIKVFYKNPFSGGEIDVSDVKMLVNRKFEGLARVYAVGKIAVPKRFQIGRKKNNFYVIMERLFPNKQLEDRMYEVLNMEGSLYFDNYGTDLLDTFMRNVKNKNIESVVSEMIRNNAKSRRYIRVIFNLAKSLTKLGVDHLDTDVHDGNFAYNKLGEVVAFDVRALPLYSKFFKSVVKKPYKHTIKEEVNANS